MTRHLNTFLSLVLLSRWKYAITKFRGVNDRTCVTVRANGINRRIEEERNRDRSVSGRGLINEKGVTWRCAAHQPRFAPFHLRFHPLLRRSFGFSFCSPSFSLTLFCFVIPMLHLLCQRNRSPRSSLVSFSLFAFRLDRLIFLFQPSLLSRIFTLPRFSAITFRNAAFSPYTLPPPYDSAVAKRFPRIPPRRVVHSRLSVY